MSENINNDSISEIDEEEYKYCARCGAKNYASVDTCYNCERCFDFVDTFEEYEKLKQSENAVALQAMLQAERKKMEAEIDARVEKKVAERLSRTETSQAPTIEKVDEKTLKEWFDKGWAYDEEGNYAEAVKWYRKAAEQGYAKAQYNLGVCCERGEGVSQSYAEAVKWYRKAAEQGHAKAQYNLGVCYDNGRGVTQSYAEAVKWYRKAAEQGYTKAQYNLGVCCERGEGVSQSYAEAVKWYRKAAEQEHAKAQYNLGVCYANGQGLMQDDAEAVKWYRKAAEQGDAKAIEALRKRGEKV